jgi:hypothetical protein
MKKNLIKYGLLAVFGGFTGLIYSQNVAINTTGTVASASAILDLSNTSSMALLCPQVSLTNVTTLAPVPAPGPAGLLVYNTNAATTGGSGTGYYFWDGAKWNYLLTGAGTTWNLTGNTGTIPGVNYVGTSDLKDLVFKTSATERMRVLAGGGVGMGTAVPKSALDVNGGISIGTYAGVNAAPANGIIISGQAGVGTATPNASAAIDVFSTTSGFLPPRMTAAQMGAIVAPAAGLMVLNSTTNCLEYYNGASWQNVTCP